MKKYELIASTLTRRPKKGWTDTELAEALGMSYADVLGTRSYAVKLGLVTQLGTKVGINGRTIKTWTAA